MVFCLNDEPALFWTGNLTENDPIVFIAIKSFEHVRNVCCLLPKLLLYFFGVNEAQQLTKSNQIKSFWITMSTRACVLCDKYCVLKSVNAIQADARLKMRNIES